MSYRYILSHQAMAFDDLRNTIYRNAIQKIITPDSVVIDLGAGIGILGLLAAHSGARKVYLVEPSTDLGVAIHTAQINNLEDKIDCVSSTIEMAQIDDKADVIISVFTGNFLLEEDLLPSLFYARETYLKTGGSMIPDRAFMEVVPVVGRRFFDKNISRWSTSLQGIDYSKVRQYAANHIYYLDHSSMADDYLAKPAILFDIDFMTATSARCDASIDITIERDGLCHGFLGWFKTRIGDEWLSTAPTDETTHWSQAFLPIDPPLEVSARDVVTFDLSRPEYGEWTWTVRRGPYKQVHSTFMSGPLNLSTIQKKSGKNRPELGELGEITKQILSRFQGVESTNEIAKDIYESNKDIFPSCKHAKAFVIKQVERFC